MTLVTCEAYYKPHNVTPYISNILLEEDLIKKSLENNGLKVDVTYWNNPSYDWQSTSAILFRTVWDYFENFKEFIIWFESVKTQTQLINSYELIKWNIDKKYLLDLERKKITIVPTTLVAKGTKDQLSIISAKKSLTDIVIKPAISAAAYQTYKIRSEEIIDNEELFASLVEKKDMLIQPYFNEITSFGEASLMIFDGCYSHAILKRAKQGDFRVQDDFGGTVHDYIPTRNEISFAEEVVSKCSSKPIYARVDIVWDKEKNPYLSELEIFEPELWIRNNPKSADMLANAVKKIL